MLIALSTFVLVAMVNPNLKAAFRVGIKDSSSTSIRKSTQSAILTRVYEIQKMDKSNLTTTEKKALKTELKSLKKNYRDNGGVYISVGGLVIIILLLILILR